jgi:hypothetical protein
MRPLNDLEVILQRAEAGQLSMSELLEAFVKSDLAVPSATEIKPDGSGMLPVLYPRNKVQMLACFTDKSRIGNFGALAPYCVIMKGSDVLGHVPLGCGLVLNPSVSTGFDVPPHEVALIARTRWSGSAVRPST